MSRARHNPEEQPDIPPLEDEYIAAAPRISVQAFCETEKTATAVRLASEDRRLAKAHLSVQMGGMPAAIENYHTAPTPNVILLETEGSSDILASLDELATVCDAGTRVVVIGNANPIANWFVAASTTTWSGPSRPSTWCARSAACSRRPKR